MVRKNPANHVAAMMFKLLCELEIGAYKNVIVLGVWRRATLI